MFLIISVDADKIIPVYIQTGDQSDYREVSKYGYLALERCDLLNILESDIGKDCQKKSDILSDCSITCVNKNEVQSFLTLQKLNYGILGRVLYKLAKCSTRWKLGLCRKSLRGNFLGFNCCSLGERTTLNFIYNLSRINSVLKYG